MPSWVRINTSAGGTATMTDVHHASHAALIGPYEWMNHSTFAGQIQEFESRVMMRISSECSKGSNSP